MTFDGALNQGRRANLAHLYAISRRDGAAFTPEDKAFISSHSPDLAHRILTDDARHVVIATNADFIPEHRQAITSRFNLEDYTGR